ncbi:Solute carrier family 2, facilitated glucose transporter member 2 [Choanephora cucurbitarum]|uniref:Solute carrier family 2, facilitated glucose transporter member 2 n=1 Tax=Choanephora cucurbitarum TaxID=101091 RepID=A0A1C7NQE4_9FUNG|nr:Solute carrier family 2, facilitated glucose transporter member 2 [Choanephora cucurbitarum]
MNEKTCQTISSMDLLYPRYMVFCVFAASFTFFSTGWVTGSPNLPGAVTHLCEQGDLHVANPVFPDCLPMGTSMWGFAVASFCIGGLIGGIAGGTIQTRLGRRKAIMCNTIGYIVGGILIGVSVSPAMFVVGRIICGFSCGLGTVATPVYVGEIATIKSRGLMGTINQLMICFGILATSLVGLPLSHVPLWRVNYALGAAPAILQAILMLFCTESPRYLVSINKIDLARTCLQKLRPGSDVTLELCSMIEGQLGSEAAAAYLASDGYFQSKIPSEETIMETISDKEKVYGSDVSSQLPTPPPMYEQESKNQMRSPMNVVEIFRDPIIRKITCIVIFIHAAQQLIGINAVMYYSTDMFGVVFDSNMASYMAIVCYAINVISTFPAIFLVDRLGRRVLLLVSEVGAVVCSILLAIGYIYNKGPLMVFSIFGYVFLFGVGIAPIPWILTSEVAPV